MYDELRSIFMFEELNNRKEVQKIELSIYLSPRVFISRRRRNNNIITRY